MKPQKQLKMKNFGYNVLGSHKINIKRLIAERDGAIIPFIGTMGINCMITDSTYAEQLVQDVTHGAFIRVGQKMFQQLDIYLFKKKTQIQFYIC